jgi:hypothetical protein
VLECDVDEELLPSRSGIICGRCRRRRATTSTATTSSSPAAAANLQVAIARGAPELAAALLRRVAGLVEGGYSLSG